MELNDKTLEQLYHYFNDLKGGVDSDGNRITKGEAWRDAWNQLEDAKCEEFAKYLREMPSTNKKYKNAYIEYMTTLHARFTQDFWNQERELIKQGRGTRNWTPDVMQHLLSSSGTFSKGAEK